MDTLTIAGLRDHNDSVQGVGDSLELPTLLDIYLLPSNSWSLTLRTLTNLNISLLSFVSEILSGEKGHQGRVPVLRSSWELPFPYLRPQPVWSPVRDRGEDRSTHWTRSIEVEGLGVRGVHISYTWSSIVSRPLCLPLLGVLRGPWYRPCTLS